MNPDSSRRVPIPEKDSVLRHVVLFKFKVGTPDQEIEKVVASFVSLKSRIPQIVSLEWGINNSPESLDKGFTHCFFLTFRSEEDRDAYLPHPDHKAFGEILGPILEDVLVVDYWAN
ncbi:Dabb family protein [Muriicola jejuensis]|uniref:Dabb family protein n=2 Tax=Muriicola jejuensis TaxID=504488 RepID=A0A6P0UBW8_9FLAO|nr:Dabb family protein [Muriicola jejuensis]NER10724.1 Dabb family protein [Muriicola jejuensis]